MERLTYWNKDLECWSYHGPSGEAAIRLAAYEDALPLERAQELAQAEKDGRLVVLPCKVGDTVYVLGERRVVECFISEIYLGDQRGIELLVSFTCDSDCNGCPFSDWSQDYSGEYSCGGEYGEASITEMDFGKTVFLTREEADAALKMREERNA